MLIILQKPLRAVKDFLSIVFYVCLMMAIVSVIYLKMFPARSWIYLLLIVFMLLVLRSSRGDAIYNFLLTIYN